MRLLHPLERGDALGVIEGRRAVGIHQRTAVAVEQRHPVADGGLVLAPRPHDRVLDDALVLQDLGLVEQLLPGGGRCADAGLLEQVFVVVEVLLIQQPRHAIDLAAHGGDVPRGGEDLVAHFLGDALGGIQRVAGLGELGVPDVVHQEDVIGGRRGGHGGRDLVVQRVVGDVLDLDLDLGVGLVEIGHDGVHLVHGRAGLFHRQHTDGGGAGGLRLATNKCDAERNGKQSEQNGAQVLHAFLLFQGYACRRDCDGV